MGVKIQNILEKEPIKLEEMKYWVAVDAFNILYQFLSTIRQPDGTPLMDHEGNITSHLAGLFYRTCNLIEKGVKLVYVFDGKPSILKKSTIYKRKEIKEKAEEKYKAALKAGNLEEARMYAQQTSRLTEEMVEESKKLLELMGIPVVQAPSEGEAQAAQMCKWGVVEASVSQDFDSLLFGAPILIRNVTIEGRRKLPRKRTFITISPERYDLAKNLARLGISQQKLIWIGMLCGTDFDEGVWGIGPKKALKLVKTYDSFDKILEKLDVEMEWKPVEEIFLHPDVKKIKKEEIKIGELQRDKLIEMMHEKHDFSLERINSALHKAFSEPLDSSQSQLKKWF